MVDLEAGVETLNNIFQEGVWDKQLLSPLRPKYRLVPTHLAGLEV